MECEPGTNFFYGFGVCSSISFCPQRSVFCWENIGEKKTEFWIGGGGGSGGGRLFQFIFPLNTQSVIEKIYGKAEKRNFEYKISFFKKHSSLKWAQYIIYSDIIRET